LTTLINKLFVEIVGGDWEQNMANITFLGQLIDSFDEHIKLLENAISKGDPAQINELRVFIFDIHKKIDTELRK
jgi:hypothetical protein